MLTNTSRGAANQLTFVLVSTLLVLPWNPAHGQALTIADLIANAADLTTFQQALVTTGLDQILSNKQDIFTVFAPIEDAFASIDDDSSSTTAAASYELLTSERIFRPEYQAHLLTWMNFHRLTHGNQREPVRSSDITDGMIISPINLIPEDIQASVSGDIISWSGNAFSDSQVVRADLFAGNGVIHKINKVFVPTSLTLLLPDWMQNFDDFSFVLSMVASSGLEDTLRQDDITFFAPNNEAIQARQQQGDPNPGPDIIKSLLLNHMVKGVWHTGRLTDGVTLQTMLGGSLVIRLSNGPFPVIRINDAANVQVKDIAARNGIIHSIDNLLIPTGGLAWNPKGAPVTGSKMGDRLGRSVAMSFNGTIIATGAVGSDDNGMLSSGQVQVRTYNSEAQQWELMGDVLSGAEAGDEFGRAVALSANGTIVAVGADKHRGRYGPWSGQVKVYEFDGQVWNPRGQALEGEAAFDAFGWSVALSSDGNILIAGAIWNDGIGGKSTGHVRVFRYDYISKEWNPLGQTIEGTQAGDQFGWSVALSAGGNTFAAGAIDHDGQNGIKSGQVRVYSYSLESNGWVQQGASLDGAAGAKPGSTYGDSFGSSVALSSDGKTVAAGAIWSNENGLNSGQVRVFTYTEAGVLGEQWVQLGDSINGPLPQTEMGRSISLSEDGTILAVGSTGGRYNGINSGVVSIFEFNPSTRRWEKVGQDLRGQQAFDKFGVSVAMSADARVIAAGSEVHNATGLFSGHLRVFER